MSLITNEPSILWFPLFVNQVHSLTPWVWLKKVGPKMAPWQVGPKTKTCGLPRRFHLEPHPAVCTTFHGTSNLRTKNSARLFGGAPGAMEPTNSFMMWTVASEKRGATERERER